ncbi:hypothetical protein D9757_001226 [Collybiopsis confluens]|uniref:E3 ubiquitin-protein ligase RNF220 middle domain-containing protein n=1 Tax=Collybiopsis confluens TaxID=2823264 RepID=A0A8H5I1J5_9AGAR|nr:hypothetical protein D9757_001226 [Collybiopsis confluens]
MRVDKGKRKRASNIIEQEQQEQAGETSEAGSRTSSTPEAAPAAKRSRRRAETRDCPICNEPIPLRLLAKHAQLEDSRLDEVISHIGSKEPFLDLTYESYASSSITISPLESTSSTSAPTGRRSAARARRTILEKTAPVRSQSTVVSKAIQSIKRNRKNRHAKLRDMAREDDENFVSSRLRITSSRGEIVCPVCLATVQGDEDVQDAHVEACIANESQRLEEERERRAAQARREEGEAAVAVDIEGNDIDAAGYFGDVQGIGFHARNHNEQDVDDEIDIDGDDAEMFGSAQFHEGDILDLEQRSTSARTHPTLGHPHVHVDESEMEGDQPVKVLRRLIAESKPKQATVPTPQATAIPEMDKADVAIVIAKKNRNAKALVIALENKIKILRLPTGRYIFVGLQSICISVSHMPGPIQRADSVYRMLAHMLSRVDRVAEGVSVTLDDWGDFLVSNHFADPMLPPSPALESFPSAHPPLPVSKTQIKLSIAKL